MDRSRLDDSARELLERAQALAHEQRHFECCGPAILWAARGLGFEPARQGGPLGVSRGVPQEDAFEILREWESRGYDATRTFQAEGQRLSRDANAIANELVALVEGHLYVTFTGMTIADEEHGVRGAIRARDVASFYMDAMHVLALAEEKISGDLQRDDGGWSDVSACVPTLTGIVERAFARLRPHRSEEKPKQTRPMAFGRGT